MRAIADAVAPLTFLFVIFAVALGRQRVRGFSPRRAKMVTRSATGDNATLMLASVNLAVLGYQLTTVQNSLRLPSDAAAALSVAVVVAGLLLLVSVRRLGETLLGFLGVTAAFGETALRDGAAGVLIVLVLTALTLYLLGAVRGFISPR